FGDLGMPPWVQLDCCTLPSAMIGFARPREHIPADTWSAILQHVERVFGAAARAAFHTYDGPVPVSEYCALPTHQPGRVVGLSLFALFSGSGSGLRTKALALRCYGAQIQIGVTQYTN